MLKTQALSILILHILESHSHPMDHCSQQGGEKGSRGHSLSLEVMACKLHAKLSPASHWLDCSHTAVPGCKGT